MYRVISRRRSQEEQQSDAKITVLPDGTLRFDTPWDPGLVRELKKIRPVNDLRPVYTDGKFQYWAVAPRWAETLANLAEKYHMGRPVVPPVVLLECGHYETTENYPIKPWPGWAYCSICDMSVLTDSHRRDIEEDDPWDSVGG